MKIVNELSTIGGRIRHKRKQANMSQFDLAEKLGMSPQNLSNYETDKQNLDVDTAMRIASILNTSAMYLIEGIDMTLSEEDKKILALFKTMDRNKRRVAYAQMEALAGL